MCLNSHDNKWPNLSAVTHCRFWKKGVHTCGGSSCPYFHHSFLQEIPQGRFQQNPEKLVADCGGRRPSERPINGGGRDVWGGRKNTVKLPKSLINSPIIRCNYWKTFSDEVLNIYTHILCSFQSSHPIFLGGGQCCQCHLVWISFPKLEWLERLHNKGVKIVRWRTLTWPFSPRAKFVLLLRNTRDLLPSLRSND